MAHCEKIKLCDVARVAKEMTRDYEVKSKYKNEVDLARYDCDYSILDINLNHLRLNDAIAMSSSRITTRTNSYVADCTYRKRKDTVGLCNWVVTCPQELVGDSEAEAKFFDTVFAFTVNRYGYDSVVTGIVHNDETTPHIHIPCVPVIRDKDGNKRLSAKEFLNKAELSGFQRDLDNECERVFGKSHLILNGRTKGGYTLSELKERTLDERERQASIKSLQEREASLRARETSLRAREIELEQDYKEKTKELDRLKRFAKAQCDYAGKLCRLAGVSADVKEQARQDAMMQNGFRKKTDEEQELN